MRYGRERRSVFKKGKGRAFLKFLLGELLLIALVSVVYLFVLQGDITAILPAQVLEAVATPTIAPPTATPVPTAVATIAPAETPTPAPTGTPVPYEALCLPAGDLAPEAPVMPDDKLKLGLSEFRAFTDAGQNVLMISGHAYIEGLDAANSTIYLMIANAETAEMIDMYQAVSAPEQANLSFDAASGSNLANAFFRASLDVSEYADGAYLLSVVVVNEETVAMNYFDDRAFHFAITEGALTVEE